jgi:phosphate starvation-inducible PhoH-like protein
MSKTRRNLNPSTNGHNKNGHNRLEDILNAKNTSLAGAAIKTEQTPADIASPLKTVVSSKTPNQKRYIRSMVENDLTLCTGQAGCGKSHCAVGVAIKYLSEGKVDRIIFIRPTVPCEEDLGFLPGELDAKLGPYLVPVFDELNYFLTPDQVNKLTSGKRPAISGCPLGMIKGRSFRRSFIILDEAQDASSVQLKRLLTRIGEGSTMVFNGDITQSDLFEENTKTDFERFIEKMEGAESVNTVRLTPEDSQRHPRIAAWLERV